MSYTTKFSVNSYLFLSILIWFVTVECGYSNQDQDVGLDIFIKACQLWGANANQISSGHIDFIEKQKDVAYMTPRNYSKQELDEMLVSFGNDVQARDNSIRLSQEKRKEMAKNGRNFNINVLFKRKSATESYCRLIISQINEKGESQFVFRGLQRYSNVKLKDSVFWGFEQNSLSIENQMPFAEYDVFRWGRIQGQYAFLSVVDLLGSSDHDKFIFSASTIEQFKQTVIKTNPEAFILTKEEKYDNNAFAKVVEVKFKGKLTQCYWIDPARGYICPLVQIYDNNTGNLVEEYISENYFLDQKTGIWFPEHYIYCIYDSKTGKEQKRNEYLVNRETFILNNKFSDDEFSLDVPEGMIINDKRGGFRYRTESKGTLSLASGGLDLDKLGWLTKVGTITIINRPNSQMLFFRVVSIVIGVLLICFSIYKMWKKRKK
jgi:outer membrane lipoprotein-sorting protein